MAEYIDYSCTPPRPCPRCRVDLLPGSKQCWFCYWAEPAVVATPPSMPRRTIIGLDLGQVHDRSALALLEMEERAIDGKSVKHYACRYLQRWPVGTPYPQIVADMKDLCGKLSSPSLVVDASSVGRAVLDQFRQARLAVSVLIAVTITGGYSITRHSFAGYAVPKTELVSATRSVIEGRRLQIAKLLREAVVLRKELGTPSAHIRRGEVRRRGRLVNTTQLEGWHDDSELSSEPSPARSFLPAALPSISSSASRRKLADSASCAERGCFMIFRSRPSVAFASSFLPS